MPFHGYGFNCEDKQCPLDCRNPHCHPQIHHTPGLNFHPKNSPYNAPSGNAAASSSTASVSAIHKPVESEEQTRDPAQQRGVQPSLGAGGRVDLSSIPGLELTTRGTFSFGGTRMNAPSVEEVVEKARQLAETISTYPAPQDEIIRASRASRMIQSGTNAAANLTQSALLEPQSRAGQAARESERSLPDLMNQMYEDRLRETARQAQARVEEDARIRELNRAAARMMLSVRQDESAARWAVIEARMDQRGMQRLNLASTRNEEVIRASNTESAPEPKRASLTTRVSELPPIHEHTAFCIHEGNGVTNENTPVETVNSSPDIDESETLTRNASNEADYGSGFKRPARVHTGDSGFGGGEDDISDFRRPSRVMTGDSAFVSGDNSRSQSRKRGTDTPEEESD